MLAAKGFVTQSREWDGRAEALHDVWQGAQLKSPTSIRRMMDGSAGVGITAGLDGFGEGQGPRAAGAAGGRVAGSTQASWHGIGSMEKVDECMAGLGRFRRDVIEKVV